MGEITIQISNKLIKKLPKNQSDIEQVLELGLAEYGVKEETVKKVRGKIRSIKEYPVCGMWADREDMVDSARWVKEIRKRHWEYRHDR
jgi:hypothetical protein